MNKGYTAKDWKAIVQPGGVYCAPCCGARCTQREHDRAEKEANALSLRLTRAYPGTKWKVCVWENMGWHYSVSCGKFDLHVVLDRSVPGGRHCWKITDYYVLLQTSPQIVGEFTLTPEAAVGDVVLKAEQFLKSLDVLKRNIQHMKGVVVYKRGVPV